MEEKIFLGMCRPDIAPLLNPGPGIGVVVCPYGHHNFSPEGTRKCWIDGHFDYAIYATKEEMMDRMAEKEKLSSCKGNR